MVCTGPLTATVAVTNASISVGLAGLLGHSDVVLPPPLTQMDRGRGVAGFAGMPQ